MANSSIKKMNFNFYPNIGLGSIKFTLSEKEVIDILGTPNEEEEIVDDDYKVVYYSYDNHIECMFHYEGAVYKHLSIFAPNAILDGFDIAASEKEIMVDSIKKYHANNSIPYRCEISRAEDVNEDYYHFENIGLTIWYSGEFVSEICVQKVDREN